MRRRGSTSSTSSRRASLPGACVQRGGGAPACPVRRPCLVPDPREHDGRWCDESASAVAGGTVADLEVRGIAKRFGSVVAIERVDIDVQRGEFVAIMGPSGCGKTTLLRNHRRAREGGRRHAAAAGRGHQRRAGAQAEHPADLAGLFALPLPQRPQEHRVRADAQAPRQEGGAPPRSRPWPRRFTWTICSRAASAS